MDDTYTNLHDMYRLIDDRYFTNKILIHSAMECDPKCDDDDLVSQVVLLVSHLMTNFNAYPCVTL